MKSNILKIIVILLVILAVILGGIGIYKMVQKDLNSSDLEQENSNETEPDEGNREVTMKIYVGSEDQGYQDYKINVMENSEVSSDLSKAINKIANVIGYRIKTNSIEVQENEYRIDFKDSSAPFEIEESYVGNGKEEMKLFDLESTIFTILDSIKTTIQNNYGDNIKVYYTVEGEEVSFENILTLDLEEEYKGSK